MAKEVSYFTLKYWDDRYADQESAFDWYHTYSGLRSTIATYIKKTDKILMLGCGNSVITEKMFEDGFKDIVNMDNSQIVIEQMRERHRDKPLISWDVMDAAEMSYVDRAFDVVFDKGGMDAILLTEDAHITAYKAMKEIFRILKPGGLYFFMSHGTPKYRLPYIQNQPEFPWELKCLTISKLVLPRDPSKPKEYYIYLCTKPAND